VKEVAGCEVITLRDGKGVHAGSERMRMLGKGGSKG